MSVRRAWFVLTCVIIAVAPSYFSAQSAGAPPPRSQQRSEMQRLAELKQAADQGDAEAQFNLGLMFAAGRGVPKDDGQAVQWYRRAIDLGQAEAQSRLELMYEEGPAPHAGAAGRAPEVVVAGIQVVRIFEPDNEALLSSPLFSGDNGTKIALWLKVHYKQQDAQP